MFRCRVYVKTENKTLAFFEVMDYREDGRDYSDFGELGLLVEANDREAISRLVRAYKDLRRKQHEKIKK
ncbi:MAG: hypothetical protein A2998_01930 [Candidatus Staskawiczbacteria bacterium RIFCSPLOWO2_01_FULL_37_25b]|uniref:Uncharacterized protein n=1 Tax=Candidatus Staskawiczbacteria bacterium RIFCSPLOWO2_01_FULL_37_25b TaxID=1802213 RepID=A0A1G2I9H8_9BACT|nr:MAG: hypothetical protein A2998_01930 [Candidatus Staskawiczbacteria bacterium RIFCSPLOWO2_01_FULL_37_25b]